MRQSNLVIILSMTSKISKLLEYAWNTPSYLTFYFDLLYSVTRFTNLHGTAAAGLLCL